MFQIATVATESWLAIAITITLHCHYAIIPSHISGLIGCLRKCPPGGVEPSLRYRRLAFSPATCRAKAMKY